MRRAGLLVLAACVLAACGKAGPPVPPQARLPAPVADLRGVLEEGAVTLTWTNPQRRADQSPLRDLFEARVYRHEDDGFVPPKPALQTQGRIAGYQEIAVIALSGSASGGPRAHAMRFVDREGLRAGRRYTYVVLVEDSRGRVSPPSTRASVRIIAPPGTPAPPTVEAGDREVRVRWQPPAAVDGGAPGPLAYEVSRSSTSDGPPEAVFPVPAGQMEFVDRGLENDRTYYYAVRAIGEEAGTTARGAPSPAVAATPARTTPPAPPTGLVATPTGGNAVSLSWTPSPDPNVAAYVVYRAFGGGELARVGTARAPATTFVDRDLRPGVYRYVVTSQDATARANESPRSNEVTVRLP